MIQNAEVTRRPDYSQFTPLELIRNNIETERVETIPLSAIVTEHALIDAGHATELGQSMQQKRGQITPIAVRPRWDDNTGSIQYDVLDGFHRTEGRKRSGAESIMATVVYGCSDEEMVDLRILAASSVRSVQFPRIAQWITQSFGLTDWARQGLRVSQAFGIAVNDKERSYIAGLRGEELDELKDWVREKCKRWGKSVNSTYAVLKLVENADPALVKEVRTQGGGKDRVGVITPARLEAVVGRFPGEENFGLQRSVLAHVVDRRLYAEETSALVDAVGSRLNPNMSSEEVHDVLSSVDLEALLKARKQEKQTDGQPKAEADDQSVVLEEPEDPPDEEIQALEAEINNNGIDAVARPRSNHTFYSPRQSGLIRASRRTTGENGHKRTPEEQEAAQLLAYSRDETPEIGVLKARVQTLEQQLEQSLNGNRVARPWWETAMFLTTAEKTILTKLLTETGDFDSVARELRLTPNRINQLLRSALVKRHVSGVK